jgi:nucleotide-binding universal stress UspA family protein
VYQRILVGTDGSPTAAEAARKAFDLGVMFMTGVTLLYVAGDPIVGAIVLEQTAKGAHRLLKIETKVVSGDPAEAICAVASSESIGLVVVGNRGMTGTRRVLLGSVPTKVIHHAPTDVLIAKTVDRVVEDLAPGGGGIVDAAGRRLGVYRDEDGSLHAVDPKCTHMGCTVDWNATERSWDCPCHGSRFSTDGSVIQGPAKKPLARETVA